jgi:peptidoglycan/LPS O-acetylase OafA/YrhL
VSADGSSRAQAPDYVPSLDGLRGLLALFVATYHFSGWTHVFGRGTPASSVVAVLGIYGVEGFFIISGFCFFHLYGVSGVDRAGLRGFHLKRYLRIAPLYYVAFALNVLLAQPVGPMTWQRVLENVTLTFGLFHPNHARVLGGWSIGIEYVFYLAFPVLAWLLRRRGALYLATLALMGLAVAHALTAPEAASMWQRFDRYVELPNHAFLFLWGGVVADVRRHSPARLSSARLALGLAILVLLCAVGQPAFQDHFDVMSGWARARLLAACFVMVLLVALHAPSAGRVQRALGWLGDHSYAVYLLHPFAGLLALWLVPVGRWPLAVFALGMLLTLLFSALSRALVERPAIALGKRLAAPSVSAP